MGLSPPVSGSDYGKRWSLRRCEEAERHVCRRWPGFRLRELILEKCDKVEVHASAEAKPEIRVPLVEE